MELKNSTFSRTIGQNTKKLTFKNFRIRFLKQKIPYYILNFYRERISHPKIPPYAPNTTQTVYNILGVNLVSLRLNQYQ